MPACRYHLPQGSHAEIWKIQAGPCFAQHASFLICQFLQLDASCPQNNSSFSGSGGVWKGHPSRNVVWTGCQKGSLGNCGARRQHYLVLDADMLWQVCETSAGLYYFKQETFSLFCHYFNIIPFANWIFSQDSHCIAVHLSQQARF